jgi:transcriptional regulator with GAF, ATPase, and Fis domain
VVRNAVERRHLKAENTALRQTLQAQQQNFAGIIGRSPRMKQVFNLIIQAAPSRSTILVTGESGTGKELVARAIHAHSTRADRAFVTVNSGNLPPDLLESTLFGHVKGAFTGAVYPKKGLCDLADKGSIFFDEIGNIPLETQAKLLRVMQEREFMRLGGMDTIRVDVRIIAATNCDLREMVDEGRFREDLYYRLHVINIPLPPLRERKEDVPVLAQHFPTSTAARTTSPVSSSPPRPWICWPTTTGPATSASSRTSSSVRSSSPRANASARISCRSTSGRRRGSGSRGSWCRQRASRSRT